MLVFRWIGLRKESTQLVCCDHQVRIHRNSVYVVIVVVAAVVVAGA